MKAEINNENKAKFFALYWGQKVAENPIGYLIVNGTTLDYIHTNSMDCILNLKPLSSISDEDAIEVARIAGVGEDDINTGLKPDFRESIIAILDENMYPLEISDFLRSRSYALPWMGLSVDEMVEAGWIRLPQ